MSERIVVDASVVPKWFFPEVHHEFTGALLDPERYELFAPPLLLVELANIAVQKTRRGVTSEEDALEFLAEAQSLPISWMSPGPLLEDCYRLSIALHPSAYDCLYVAAALALGCQLVTADRELYDRMIPQHAQNVIWVEDIPQPGA